MYCITDFETRSQCDLKKRGAWNYSKHPTTELLVFSVWDSVSGSVSTWNPNAFEVVPLWLQERLTRSQYWVAHNYFFEYSLWKNHIEPVYGLPCPPLDRWIDTRAIVLQWSLPRSLEGASSVLGIAEKDMEGARLMQKMCKPLPEKQRKKKLYHWTPEDLKRLSEYCEKDVLATKAILDELGNIQKCEVPIYRLDQVINNRGFKIDVELCQAGFEIAEQLNHEAEIQLAEITEGAVTKVNQHARIKKFALSENYPLGSTDKASIVEYLNDPKLPDRLRQVLEIRQAIGKSSVAKYRKALDLCDKDDHRIRDAFVLHMAGTGRWAGQGFQSQNLPRGDVKIPEDKLEDLINAVKAGDVATVETFGSPMVVLSGLLRSAIVAEEGCKFVDNDFSGVESRGVLWLAGETEAVEMLRSGVDLYKEMASVIFGKPVSEITGDERFIGKTTILGCGYGMGASKFSLTNGADLYLAEKSVQGYRNRFKGVPKLWYGLENAFRNTLRYKTESGYAGISFYWKKPRVIACRLLSGREIHYWDPSIDDNNQICYMTVGTGGKWHKTTTWGGKITENVIQAICNDLLRYSQLQLAKAGWPIVLHAHDQNTVEVPDSPEYTVEGMARIMVELPPWAKGFPLAVEGWQGKRFRK